LEAELAVQPAGFATGSRATATALGARWHASSITPAARPMATASSHDAAAEPSPLPVRPHGDVNHLQQRRAITDMRPGSSPARRLAAHQLAGSPAVAAASSIALRPAAHRSAQYSSGAGAA